MGLNANAVPFLIVEWTLCSLAIVAVAMRTIALVVCHRKFKLDDFLVLLALAITIVLCGITTTAFHYGFGLHVADLVATPKNLTNALKYIQLQFAPSVLSPLCSRVAFSLYLLDIIGKSSRWQRNSLWSLVWTQIPINIGTVVLGFTLCGTHVTAIWGATQAKCLSSTVLHAYAYFSGAVNVLSDIYLSALPVHIIMRLQIPLRKKLQLQALLCASLLVAAACLTKTVLISRLGPGADYTYDALGVVIAGEIEATLIIILVCLPACAALLNHSDNTATSSKDDESSIYHATSSNKAYCAATSTSAWNRENVGISLLNETIVSSSEENILRSKLS